MDDDLLYITSHYKQNIPFMYGMCFVLFITVPKLASIWVPSGLYPDRARIMHCLAQQHEAIPTKHSLERSSRSATFEMSRNHLDRFDCCVCFWYHLRRGDCGASHWRSRPAAVATPPRSSSWCGTNQKTTGASGLGGGGRATNGNIDSSEQSNEMVYWQDIPSDHAFQSPFFVQRPANDEEDTTNDDVAAHARRHPYYLTFVMDEGGYNNIRMAYETVLAMSHAMGRTLVLPPNQEMYLLNDGGGRQEEQQQQQRKDFGFQDFFPIERIAAQIQGMSIISTEEFLVREALNGTLRDRQSGQVSFPPHNRTNWDGDSHAIIKELQPWLETVSYQPDWSPDQCVAAFPAEPGNSLLEQKFNAILNLGGFRTPESYVANPTAVYGSTIDRLGEVLNGRTHLCVYNNQTNERLWHLHGKQQLGTRLLTHFYAFLFFEDWQQDLWTKRFIRDQLHYRDEIQCAAARIVAAIRSSSNSNNSSTRGGSSGGGPYDAFHVRRGEFQYQRTRVTAQELYEMAKEQIPENATVYIATDERDRRFFDDLAMHYHLLFLDDFHHLLTDVNTNLYGLIDQLVASRSRTFFGCWFSTYVLSQGDQMAFISTVIILSTQLYVLH
jgi:GDP-fucose protein O-fucosyltransferase